jgi:hypothetical protein
MGRIDLATEDGCGGRPGMILARKGRFVHANNGARYVGRLVGAGRARRPVDRAGVVGQAH